MSRRLTALVPLIALLGALPVATGPAAAALQDGVAVTGAALPTWQTDGIVWAAAEANGLVFVGGTFTAVRPPGTAGGAAGSLPRTNLAVLDAATGEPTSCAPAVTAASGATVRSLDVSPDGRTLYVGGLFTSVAGAGRQHLAAVDISSCTVVGGFVPRPSGIVRAVEATSSAVYYGGGMVSVDGAARSRAAAAGAVGTSTVGSLLDWAPVLDKEVRALAVRPDGSEVVVGGDFDTANGAPSHALAVVDPTSGGNLYAYPGLIEAESVVKDLEVDDTGFYTANEGTGHQKFDGRIAVDWSTHAERWRDTCYGATQAVAVHAGVLYSGSHAHDCSAMGGFPDGPRRYLLAQRTSQPALLPWFPQTNGGLGEALGPRGIVVSQGPSGTFLWAVGEFTTVNGQPQQGLARFGAGPAQMAPTAPTASATSVRAGEVRLAWRQSFDADDAMLRYDVYRGTSTVPVYTATAASWFWAREQMVFVDPGLEPGSRQTYRVTVTDGTATASSTRSVTVAATDSAYAARVLADGAGALWRYGETADVFFSDTSPANANLTLSGGATPGAAGALAGDDSPAVTLAGTSATLHGERRLPAPGAFSVETWFRTTTTSGGKLIGFGEMQVQPSRLADRHVYMTNTGQLVFGVHNGSVRTLTSPQSYNDGAWHHVVATQGSGGMRLHVDGVQVGSNTVTTARRNQGYWRVAGDNIGCKKTSCYGVVWPSAPTSDHFGGTLDETAVYPFALSAATVQAHHALGTGSSAPGGDVSAPSVPSQVGVAVSGSVPTVSWSASSDDVGVVGYEVHRSTSSSFAVDAGTLVGSAAGTSFTDSARTAGTWYYRVLAKDAAGNASAASAAVAATVAAEPTVPAEPVEPTVVTVVAGEDSYANALAASSNYGTSASLASRGSGGYVSYLRFAVPAAPAGTSLTRAELRFRTTTDAGSASADLQRIGFAQEGWTETGVTWNNRPSLVGEALGTVSVPSVSAVHTASLDVAALQGLPGTTQTLAVSSTGTDAMWFWSRNHSNSTYRPALLLTYASGGSAPGGDVSAPSVPSQVGVAVSGSVPTVSWSASSDDVGVVGYEVHRSTSSSFAVDAGTLVGSAAGTSFTDSARTAGTWYYRVLAKDAAGNASAASAAVAATVAAEPTVPAEPVEPTVVTVVAGEDSYANALAASSNYGTSASLASRGSGGYVSYLRFAVPAAPAGTSLTRAELRFRTTTDAGSASADLQRIGFAQEGWTETGVTWNNRPSLVGEALGTVSVPSVSAVHTASLDVAALQGLPGTTQTLAVSSTGTDAMWFWSRNHSNSTYRPALLLTYS